jgi:hypothetical protein
MRTGMDYLAVGDYLLSKAEQPRRVREDSWTSDFEPD